MNILMVLMKTNSYLNLICVCGKETILENVPHYMVINQISIQFAAMTVLG